MKRTDRIRSAPCVGAVVSLLASAAVYGFFEQGLMGADIDLNDPVAYASVRRFLRPDLVPFQTVVDSRAGRPPLKEDWYRRIWLYRNLEPNAMPELERLLQEHLEKNIDRFKQRATDAVEQAVKVRDKLFPGIPLILGEGASYCADHRLRWEERSDAYWEVVERRPRLPRARTVGRRGAHEFRTGRAGLARVPRAAAACERRVLGRETVTS